MAESILEQIAQWHLAMINSITVANGYQQTLTATRTEEKFIAGDTLRDLDAVCTLSDHEQAVQKDNETFDDENPTITWWQRFDCFIYVIGKGSTDLEVDNRITRIVADVLLRLGVELNTHRTTDDGYCNGLAKAIDIMPWDIVKVPGDDAWCTRVNVPIRIKYTVLTRDPYTQP